MTNVISMPQGHQVEEEPTAEVLQPAFETPNSPEAEALSMVERRLGFRLNGLENQAPAESQPELYDKAGSEKLVGNTAAWVQYCRTLALADPHEFPLPF